MKKHRVEVLAPAGSYDIMTAVIKAGADAVYLGGELFGARAFAGNLNREEMIKALDYAHLRERKIYMTVNTLLKEEECGRLVDYIAPFYEAGLDAAIVQDMGAFKLLHDTFPDLPLHASTQMTVTGSKSASVLKKMGASRIVTARELTLDEIRKIHEECDIEIESFVHGALCYCYSGQCLLSSMNGTRSGNRGRCAQVCRLDYTVEAEGEQREIKVINDRASAYALSPKDMCALEILPDIIEAGVYSMKIEGRMKNATYAAGVTELYRKYTDMYLENGRSGYRVSQSDINALMDIYNRGGFTSGYYNEEKGSKMMSLSRPNHMGVKALQVLKNENGRVLFRALTDINAQDVFEIDRENSFTSGAACKSGGTFTVNLPKKYAPDKGRVLYRTKNGAIAQHVSECFTENPYAGKSLVDMLLRAFLGKPLELCLSACGIQVRVKGGVVEAAGKQPATEEACLKNLSKLGNTEFVPGLLRAEVDESVFVPVSALNELRRAGVQKLTDAVIERNRRKWNGMSVKKTDGIINAAGKRRSDNAVPEKSIYISDRQQVIKLLSGENEDGVSETSVIYLDFKLFDLPDCDIFIRQLKEKTSRVAAALPHIVTQEQQERCRKLICRVLDCGVRTFLVRCLEEIGLLAETADGKGLSRYETSSREPDIGIITDANLYCWNSRAAKQYRDIAADAGLRLVRITLPLELSFKEIMQIQCETDTELIVRADIPVMISKQCVRKTYGLCSHDNASVTLKNRRGDIYNVKSVCDYCYSVMYGAKQLDISENKKLIDSISPDYIRYETDKEHSASAWAGHYVMGVE